MRFCPMCSNILLVGNSSEGLDQMQFRCQTCDYSRSIPHVVSKTVTMKKKEVDDVLGGEEAWKNVDTTEATCPKCGHNQAYFFQMQTRSADEPMTIFYKCARKKPQCGHRWKEV